LQHALCQHGHKAALLLVHGAAGILCVAELLELALSTPILHRGNSLTKAMVLVSRGAQPVYACFCSVPEQGDEQMFQSPSFT
jgi:hypothetical protein